MIQIMARVSFKTSGFGYTVNFVFASCTFGVWWTIFKCKVCESKLKIDEFSCPLGIVSFLFPVKRGYFFETSGTNKNLL